MDFDDLTHFAVLAEELNFRRATQRLDVRQPTLTRRIRRLEQELGVYLLERHTRRINLTGAGEILAERSHHLIDEQAKLTSEIVQTATGSFGELSIGFYTSLASEILMPVLREFARTSDVRINLFEKTPRHQVRDLRDGSIDLALVIGGMPDEDLNAEGLWIEGLPTLGQIQPIERPLRWRRDRLKARRWRPSVASPRYHGGIGGAVQARAVNAKTRIATTSARMDNGCGRSVTSLAEIGAAWKKTPQDAAAASLCSNGRTEAS